MQDSIEKTLELRAPIDRVWRALTDHREFNQWFRVELETPFVTGESSRGRVTYPGYEHLELEATVLRMEPPHRFAFEWCPLDHPDLDSEEAKSYRTVVEFRLEATQVDGTDGTRLHLSESGFASLPDDPRRIDAFRRNEQGWNEQAKNIRAHVESD